MIFQLTPALDVAEDYPSSRDRLGDLDADEIAARAIAAFELSQSLIERWVKADYAAKRTILEIVVESALLNSEKIEIQMKKPFDVLSNGVSKTLTGATGNRTPTC